MSSAQWPCLWKGRSWVLCLPCYLMLKHGREHMPNNRTDIKSSVQQVFRFNLIFTPARNCLPAHSFVYTHFPSFNHMQNTSNTPLQLVYRSFGHFCLSVRLAYIIKTNNPLFGWLPLPNEEHPVIMCEKYKANIQRERQRFLISEKMHDIQ